MRVVLIGAGNTATVLGSNILHAGHEVVQVLGRSEDHASRLAEALNASFILSWDQLTREADIYILAIPDDHLYDLDDKMNLDDKLVVHVAGSVPMEVIGRISTRYGVLYPLQSLRKEVPNIQNIPLLIDGSTPLVLEEISRFARTLSDTVEMASDDKRMKLHLAAVIVSNFSNHLFVLAQEYCEREKLSFSLLLPLIFETAFRLQFAPASAMQTGPAIRHDQKTIEKHLHLLESEPSIRKIYEVFTRSIQALL